MLRNALENAFSFATQVVRIEVKWDENEVRLVIEDDGPGLTPDAIARFGVRRATRFLGETSEGRLSVGLGSVILKTVAQIHRGDVIAGNRNASNGKTGARI